MTTFKRISTFYTFSAPFRHKPTLTNSNSSSSDCTQHGRGKRVTKAAGTQKSSSSSGKCYSDTRYIQNECKYKFFIDSVPVGDFKRLETFFYFLGPGFKGTAPPTWSAFLPAALHTATLLGQYLRGPSSRQQSVFGTSRTLPLYLYLTPPIATPPGLTRPFISYWMPCSLGDRHDFMFSYSPQ